MKRRLAIAAALLVLGVAINIAIAWVCARWSVLRVLTSSAGQHRATTAWPAPPPPDWPAVAQKNSSMSGLGLRSNTYLGTDRAQGRFWRMDEFRAGLPFHALACTQELSAIPVPGRVIPVTTRDAWRTEAGGAGLTMGTGLKGRVVGLAPLRPLWPGFVANSILYSAVLAVIVIAPRLLQRFLRDYYGLCRTCGYSRAGLAKGTRCPECGRL